MAETAPTRKLSVLKRARQTVKRNARNTSVRSMLKTCSKKVASAVESKDKENIEKVLREAVKAFSMAVSKGVMHKNTASRNISRLSKLADTVLKAEAA